MTTIRRTLSPVPRPGTLLGNEACSVASPLSKCSSCNEEYTPTSGSISISYFASTGYWFYRIQSFIISLFSKRTSRPLERQKLKGNVWRKALFHFLICFLIGVFVGFTPFASIKMSPNLISINQGFSFEKIGNVRLYDVNQENLTRAMETLVANNVTLDLELKKQVNYVKEDNEMSNGSVLFASFQDFEMGFDKFLIVVTPTYPRPFQAYYLNRLAHTLKLVKPPLLWIVVEMTSQSSQTVELLRGSGVMYRHLVCTKNTTEIRDSRVHQRNVALLHIETHRLDGIVYFADDTNIYSTQLFEQMRRIRRFGTWPMAKLKTNTRLATLVGPTCNGTRVIGWHTNDVMRRFRRFHAEMSGFAFNSSILWDPQKWQRPSLEPIRQLDAVKDGLQASTFIEQIVEDETEMEGVPEDCSEVLVWRLPMESSKSNPQEWLMRSNLDAIVPL